MSLLDLTEAPTKAGVALQFTIQKPLLERLLAVTASCASTKDVQPILGNFLIEANDKGLMVATSNAMVSAVVRLPVTNAVQQGRAVFPVALLQTVAREANGNVSVKVTTKKGKHAAMLVSGTAKWNFPLMSPDGFPDFSNLLDVPVQEVDRLAVEHSLKRVFKAVSQDSMKPYLMLVDVKHGKMRASDGVRFQQTKTTMPFDCRIPAQCVPELLKRLASSKHEKIGVEQTDRALLFRFGFVTLAVQKVIAQFPDVDEVLLKPALGNDQSLLVDRKALEEAVRKVRMVADEETSAVVLSLNQGSVTVEAKDRRGSSATEEVAAEWNHPPRHVTFNHRHLTDLLGSVTSEQCWIKFGRDLKSRPSPLLLEDDGFLAVLSQIRLDWMI